MKIEKIKMSVENIKCMGSSVNKNASMLRDFLVSISFIFIFVYVLFNYQYAFNYETNIYGYYTIAFVTIIAVVLYCLVSLLIEKRQSDNLDLTLTPALLILLYVLNIGNEYACVLTSFLILFLLLKSVSLDVLKYLIYIAVCLYIVQFAYTSSYLFYNNKSEYNNTIENTGVFSIYCIIFIPTWHYLLKKNLTKVAFNIIFGFYLILIFCLIIYLQSRTSIAALAVILFAQYVMSWWKKISRKERVIYFVVFFIIIILAVNFFFNLKQGSSFGRILMLEIALRNINESMFFGTGVGKFTWFYPQWQSNFFNTEINPRTEYFLHAGETYVIFNEFIQLLISVGAFLFILMIIFTIWFFCQKSEYENKLLRTIKGTFLLVICCSFTYYTLHINVILALIGLYSAVSYKILSSETNNTRKKSFLGKGIKIIILTTSIVSLNIGQAKHKAITKWKYLRNSDASSPDLVSKELSFINYHIKNDGKFLADYGNYIYEYQSNIDQAIYFIERAHSSFISLQSKEILAYLYAEQKDYDKAIESFQWLVNYIPNRFKYRLELIELYKLTDHIDKAKSLAEKTLAMPVKIPSTEVDMIKSRISIINDSLSNYKPSF